MDRSALQLTLREWRAHFAQPVTWAAMLGIAAILALAGPFGTDGVLRFLPRLLYWSAIVLLSYSAGYLVNGSIARHYQDAPVPPKAIAGGLLTGLCVTLVVTLANQITFGVWPELAELPQFIGPVFAIAVIISWISYLLSVQHQGTASDSTAPDQAPPLLNRLPFDKRGALQALSVEDHYVRVLTAKGEALLLMRLSDAIREVGGTEGAQLHRSHWVAWAAVEAVRRDRDRAILTLKGGAEVPVSRANLPKLKERGLLPK